jgi:large subunit ribosomal protein L53
MITRYLTDVTAKFNPFSKRAKAARVFMAMIPAEARSSIKITTTILPRTNNATPVLDLKFSMF